MSYSNLNCSYSPNVCFLTEMGDSTSSTSFPEDPIKNFQIDFLDSILPLGSDDSCFSEINLDNGLDSTVPTCIDQFSFADFSSDSDMSNIEFKLDVPGCKEENLHLNSFQLDNNIGIFSDSNNLATDCNDKYSEVPIHQKRTKLPKKQYNYRKKKLEDSKNWAKGDWTTKEDEMLINYYKKIGSNWKTISSIIKTRSNKQCRNRYVSVLEPKLNGERGVPWTIYEDLLIISNYPKYRHSWMEYTKFLTKRTNDDIKNRWLKNLSIDGKREYYYQFLDSNGNIIQTNEIYEVSPKWYLMKNKQKKLN